MVASKSELMVLKTLTAMGPWQGYGIAQCVEQISEQALEISQGTISASLLCLQQQGWISSGGSSENNRRAKFSCIAKTARKQLSAEAAKRGVDLSGDGSRCR